MSRFQCPKGHWVEMNKLGSEGTFECAECNAAKPDKPLTAQSKSEYKRLKAQGANVEPMPDSTPTPAPPKGLVQDLREARSAAERWCKSAAHWQQEAERAESELTRSRAALLKPFDAGEWLFKHRTVYDALSKAMGSGSIGGAPAEIAKALQPLLDAYARAALLEMERQRDVWKASFEVQAANKEHIIGEWAKEQARAEAAEQSLAQQRKCLKCRLMSGQSSSVGAEE